MTERCITGQVEEELKRQGACFLTQEQSEKLSGFLLRANGTMNPKIVGKTAQQIADMAGAFDPGRDTPSRFAPGPGKCQQEKSVFP